MALEGGIEPEQPEAMSIVYEARTLGIPYIAGDIYHLPHIYRMELHAVHDAENEFRREKDELEALKALYNDAQNAKDVKKNNLEDAATA